MSRRTGFCVAVLACILSHGFAQVEPGTKTEAKPDLTKQPTLYLVAYAHLDTEWRWEYPLVIREYLSKTMRNNFALFEKYPDYIFNFSGANRYRLMKEYYPDDYKRLQQYVAAGRWYPAGSSMEESDVNSPSAESIFRQVLYGNAYFRRDFGRASAEYMLPDCFGFPASLPSILAHAGIRGFSTQKLTWGSSAAAGGWDSPEKTPRGTPFNVGVWEGPDGKGILAALNPGSYAADLTTDVTKALPLNAEPQRGKTPEEKALWKYQDDWATRVRHNGEVSGLFTDYHYYGTGDIGGGPTEDSVRLLEAMLHKREYPLSHYAGNEQAGTPGAEVTVGDGGVRVISAAADQMFLDIGANTARLPHFKGELELTNHSAGSLTSEAYQKRWNRENELLADAAEKASLLAMWLGGRAYPQQRLNDAWALVMGGQFHDIMAGTATPQSYNYAWNDDVIAMNQFAGVLTDASGVVARAMDTSGDGTAIVVYNPLNVVREDVVEAALPAVNGGVRVLGPDGKEVASQREGDKVLFVAKTPSVGYAVYHILPSSSETASQSSELKVTESSLENARYRVKIDSNGDVNSIFDKKLNKELLASAARLAFQSESPKQWPAWNMDWEDQQKPPRGYVSGPAKMRVVEDGPARVAVEITRESEGSKFVQTVRLSAGDAGNRVEFANEIEWRTKAVALKATFPLSVHNETATYNWDVGTLERKTNNDKMFEMPSHQWFDLTDKSGSAGVTVLSDCKYASDKPDDHTLRLTLVYTPGLQGWSDYADQTTQDLGHHHIVYGIAAHDGDWRNGRTDWQAYRLNQPLIAFVASKHGGTLGKQVSLLQVDTPNVRALAIKKAEESDEIIFRAVETDGKAATAHFKFAAPVTEAREVNGQEMQIGPAKAAGGELIATFTPYQIHTIALKLAPAPAKVSATKFAAVEIPADISVATRTGKPGEGCFDCSLSDPTADGQGHALPAEMLPEKLSFAGVEFQVNGGKAMIARGQQVDLPEGDFNRVYVLAAAVGGDQTGRFSAGDQMFDIKVPEWTGFVGQWDNREWNIRQEQVPAQGSEAARTRTVMDFTGKITPGYIKRTDIAWYVSHRHAQDASNEAYAYSYLFAIPMKLPQGTTKFTLPKNEKIRVLAITVAKEDGVEPVQPLYDVLGDTSYDAAAR